MTTAIICGGRSYGVVPRFIDAPNYTTQQQVALDEQHRLAVILREARERLGVTKMVMGDQTGADRWATSWCEGNSMPFKVYAAAWEEEGRRAGPIRNLRMIKEEVPMPTICIAFPGANGTLDMCKKADAHFIRVIPIDWVIKP